MRQKRYSRSSSRPKRRSPKVSKAFIPYPLAIFLLLCMGVLMIGWTYKAIADSIAVRASVVVPLPNRPAIINEPANGIHVSRAPVTVSGSCPDNSYVKLYRNNVFAGTTLCSADNLFSLSVNPDKGFNKLQARVFNFSDQEGPPSAMTIFYYDSQKTFGNLAPLVLNLASDAKFTGYAVGQTVEIHLVAGGGRAPYYFDIDWGDNDPRVVRDVAGPFVLTHTYARAGEYLGSHTIKINVTDASGQTTYLEIFVIVTPKADQVQAGQAGGGPSSQPPSSVFASTKSWLLLAWPAYGVIILMTVSYFLGEKEEFLSLRSHGRLRR